ncbi:phasin family protein [Novosphingobium sp. M1R2S20]|uniref:Phasin family protein n=1 Tax=Novosphingobium rhizovicinum TaxID=3228928 RepID=A0ABV3RA24_9SPHN
MDMSANFNGFQGMMSEAQAKAQEAFEKSTSMLGEVSEFTKGNVEAVIESGRIFADGCQDMSTALITEGRTAFETMTADVKELAAAKSPTDFFKIQSDMVRKSFDTAAAYGSKNSEAMLKLMSDAMAPISGRMNVAVEKARQTAMPSGAL